MPINFQSGGLNQQALLQLFLRRQDQIADQDRKRREQVEDFQLRRQAQVEDFRRRQEEQLFNFGLSASKDGMVLDVADPAKRSALQSLAGQSLRLKSLDKTISQGGESVANLLPPAGAAQTPQTTPQAAGTALQNVLAAIAAEQPDIPDSAFPGPPLFIDGQANKPEFVRRQRLREQAGDPTQARQRELVANIQAQQGRTEATLFEERRLESRTERAAGAENRRLIDRQRRQEARKRANPVRQVEEFDSLRKRAAEAGNRGLAKDIDRLKSNFLQIQGLEITAGDLDQGLREVANLRRLEADMEETLNAVLDSQTAGGFGLPGTLRRLVQTTTGSLADFASDPAIPMSEGVRQAIRDAIDAAPDLGEGDDQFSAQALPAVEMLLAWEIARAVKGSDRSGGRAPTLKEATNWARVLNLQGATSQNAVAARVKVIKRALSRNADVATGLLDLYGVDVERALAGGILPSDTPDDAARFNTLKSRLGNGQ